MLSQSFTSKNLRIIYDKENRKGDYIEKGFPAEVKEYSLIIKRLRRVRSNLNKRKEKYSEEVFNYRFHKLKESIKENDSKRDEVIDSHLEKISQAIAKRTFKISIERNNSPHHHKETYRINSELESFFAEKKIQQNIKSTYNVKQANRDIVISQLKSVLDDAFPKQIIKTDISGFYESIDSDILKSKINSNPKLSLASRKIISQILNQYRSITGSSKGIPRGIGISAYLSELYMSEFDEKIKSMPGVVYYTRYVDDIIAVFTPSDFFTADDRQREIAELMLNIGLSLNKNKTKIINYNKGVSYSIEYLGYIIRQHGGKLGICASERKVDKYKDRLNTAFDKYSKSYGSDNDKKLLLARVRMLTGNTKLTNNKGGAFVGIYHSNKWVDNLEFLDQLDHCLNIRALDLNCDTLKRKVMKFSFKRGFLNKEFRKFSTQDLKEITRVWNQ
ncbi:antiviral reverse transcriptase Drt3a [Halomonas sp. G11]|uniref:antiviral reverse transcriptase Drt3a n=1 Tax=Halomonas sp. G11 TaxID=1684425 RepID=UPI0007FF1899|nr:antiviral reverse transcriptase Drt3a [Halomonas sp. G11]OAZ91562.1 hypothetical protein ADS46_06910 [Halomonas sp. G11]